MSGPLAPGPSRSLTERVSVYRSQTIPTFTLGPDRKRTKISKGPDVSVVLVFVESGRNPPPRLHIGGRRRGGVC